MEEAPATQYLFAPASVMYHLAENDLFAVCGFYAGRRGEPKRRRDDWRITDEKPKRQFDALCPACLRKLNGEPKPEINWKVVKFLRPIEALPC